MRAAAAITEEQQAQIRTALLQTDPAISDAKSEARVKDNTVKLVQVALHKTGPQFVLLQPTTLSLLAEVLAQDAELGLILLSHCLRTVLANDSVRKQLSTQPLLRSVFQSAVKAVASSKLDSSTGSVMFITYGALVFPDLVDELLPIVPRIVNQVHCTTSVAWIRCVCVCVCVFVLMCLGLVVLNHRLTDAFFYPAERWRVSVQRCIPS